MKKKALVYLLSCTMLFQAAAPLVSAEEWGDELEWLSEEWGEPEAFDDSFEEDWSEWEEDFEESEFEDFEGVDEFQTDGFPETYDEEAWDMPDENDWTEEDFEELMPGEELTPEETETSGEDNAESLVEDIPQTIGEYSGDCGDDITWKLSGTTLEISGSGPMWDYDSSQTSLLPPWHMHRIPESEYVTTIIISEGVSYIGEEAFSDLLNAVHITIPSTVKEIGDHAFTCCFRRAEGDLVIPEGVEKIGSNVFVDCYRMKSVQFPSTLKIIGDNAFGFCKSLGSIQIPAGVEEIGDYAFSDIGIGSLTILSKNLKIGKGAFESCDWLREVVLPEGVKTLGAGAFASCSRLTSLTAPTSLVSIGSDLFEESPNVVVTAECISYMAEYCKNEGIPLNRDHCYQMTIDSYATVTTTGRGTAICVCGETGGKTVDKLVPVKTITAENVSSLKNVTVSFAKKKSLFYQGVDVVKIVMPEDGDLRINISNTSNIEEVQFCDSGSFKGTNSILTSSTAQFPLKKGSYYLRVIRKYQEDVYGYHREYPAASMKVKLRYLKDNSIESDEPIKPYSNTERKFRLTVSAKGSPTITYAINLSNLSISSGGIVRIPAKFIGKATITIKTAQTSLYRATTKKVTLTVKPSQPVISLLENTAAGSLKVKWSYSSVVTGYEVQVALNSSFTSSLKKYTASSNKTLYRTFTGLTKGKKYYVRMRKYKTWNGEKIYSSWSPVKSIVIKK